MTSIQLFVCDCCDFMSYDREEMETHEANHYHLSKEDYHTWRNYRMLVDYYGQMKMDQPENPVYDYEFKTYMKELMELEERHSVECKFVNRGICYPVYVTHRKQTEDEWKKVKK